MMQGQHSRFVAGLVLLVGYVAACDGVTDEGDTYPIESLLAMPGASAPLELLVEAPADVGEGEAVPVRMILRNTGSAPIRVEIDQQVGPASTLVPVYNFFVLENETDFVRARLPLLVAVGPAIHDLRPNDTLEFEWTWDQRDQDGESVGSGVYQVIGSLGVDTGPDIRTEPVSVTIR